MSKRSAASRPRQRRPPIFYVDECVGAHAAATLAGAGYHTRSYLDHFRGWKDVDWLPAVARLQWVVITKDQQLRQNQLEIETILNAGVRAFVITAGGLHRDEQATLLLRVMPKLIRICERRGPFIFNVTRAGTVSEVSNRRLRRNARRDRTREP